MTHLSPVPSGDPSPGAGGRRHLADLLQRCAPRRRGGVRRAGTTPPRRRVLRPRAPRRPRPGPGRGGHPGGLPRDAGAPPPGSTRARGSALSWLLTIAHRKAVDRVRSAEASGRRDTTYHQREQTVDARHHGRGRDGVDRGPPGARRARRPDQVQREALELAYFGGYTHTEVATMLDLPVGTAKTRIRDGLIRLRDAMGVGNEVATA